MLIDLMLQGWHENQSEVVFHRIREAQRCVGIMVGICVGLSFAIGVRLPIAGFGFGNIFFICGNCGGAAVFFS